MMAYPVATTAPQLRCYLLGRFHIEGTAGPVQLPRRKVEALLAYLLLHPIEHSREKLATLLWGDSPDPEARHSLRTALATLRQCLGHDLLLTDRDRVQLNPDYPLWSDVHEFEQRSKAEASISNLRAIISLYQGDLLTDFYDDWLTPERELYRCHYLEALLRLTQGMRSCHEYKQGVEFARQALAADPSNERAHQHLMFCLMASGDRSAALAQYEICRQVLHTELGVEPLPETTALYHRIKQASAEHESFEAHLTNLPIPLTSFIGRQRELAEIKRWLAPLPSSNRAGSPVRLLTLTGAGGVGKTHPTKYPYRNNTFPHRNRHGH
jgi:DNA-binding SARP family transcriptional activator